MCFRQEPHKLRVLGKPLGRSVDAGVAEVRADPQVVGRLPHVLHGEGPLDQVLEKWTLITDGPI
jgi:hypothetical protein